MSQRAIDWILERMNAEHSVMGLSFILEDGGAVIDPETIERHRLHWTQ